MPNCCLTLSQVDEVKKDNPKRCSAVRLSHSCSATMATRVNKMAKPASRAAHWKTSSALTRNDRAVANGDWAAGRSTSASGPPRCAAGELLAGEGSLAIHFDPADELFATLDDLGRQG